MGEHLRLSKSELRRRVLAARRQRSHEQLAAASQAICRQGLGLITFRLGRHLVGYAARPGEVDPAGLVESGLASRKAVYFPRVVGPSLEFLCAMPTELEPGAYGVPEPATGPRLSRAAVGVLFLVPGLAFDPNGGRLGRGGGHYDRALARYPGGLRLGLSVDADVAPVVPCDPWDQRVDVVVTERRLLWSAARPEAARKENLE